MLGVWHMALTESGLMEFTTFYISKLFGIPRSTIQLALDRGMIQPSIQRAEGRGTKNLFSKTDLFLLRIFHKLCETGLSQKEASEYLSYFDFDVIEKKGLHFAYIISDERGKKELHFASHGGVMLEKLHGPSEVLIVIKIKQIIENVEAILSGTS